MPLSPLSFTPLLPLSFTPHSSLSFTPFSPCEFYATLTFEFYPTLTFEKAQRRSPSSTFSFSIKRIHWIKEPLFICQVESGGLKTQLKSFRQSCFSTILRKFPTIKEGRNKERSKRSPDLPKNQAGKPTNSLKIGNTDKCRRQKL